eukprot:TRINITY_DN13505_c0_g1_i1.p1 TRINITY_DN13505_c0_g1~~TRINITY_DN13505_c0_g1_i1.p1  ORF type:complete len:130 (-),score=48.23 TRINITY_DN13505_c0_g1_i1:92-481(-)
MSPALPEAGEPKYQKTAMVRSPNMMKRILRKKEDKENNRKSLDLRFSQEIQEIPTPSLFDLSLNDVTSDETDAGGENQKQSFETDSILEIELNQEKFSCHMDSMKRYKKQVSRNSESVNREEGKGEVGV